METAETVRMNADYTTGENKEKKWTEVIEPKVHLLDLKLVELWRYRDLVMMFVRRDFVANYKQTILGPLWFFIQPLLTSLTFFIIFSKVAKVNTEGPSPILFYLAGLTIWNYFAESLTKTATVFKDNAQIFGKVYFPRLTMPLSIVIASLVKFVIQMALFLAVWLYYLLTTSQLHPNVYLLLVPLLVVQMGLLALGVGMIISAMTTKYKDLIFLLTFGVQLMMYAAPVIYPLSTVSEKYKWLVVANPVSSIVETFRYAFLGYGSFRWDYLAYSALATLLLLFVGTIVFNKVEKSFADTV